MNKSHVWDSICYHADGTKGLCHKNNCVWEIKDLIDCIESNWHTEIYFKNFIPSIINQLKDLFNNDENFELLVNKNQVTINNHNYIKKFGMYTFSNETCLTVYDNKLKKKSSINDFINNVGDKALLIFHYSLHNARYMYNFINSQRLVDAGIKLKLVYGSEDILTNRGYEYYSVTR